MQDYEDRLRAFGLITLDKRKKERKKKKKKRKEGRVAVGGGGDHSLDFQHPVNRDGHIKAKRVISKPQANVQCLFHVTRHFMFGEDWSDNQVE